MGTPVRAPVDGVVRHTVGRRRRHRGLRAHRRRPRGLSRPPVGLLRREAGPDGEGRRRRRLRRQHRQRRRRRGPRALRDPSEGQGPGQPQAVPRPVDRASDASGAGAAASQYQVAAAPSVPTVLTRALSTRRPAITHRARRVRNWHGRARRTRPAARCASPRSKRRPRRVSVNWSKRARRWPSSSVNRRRAADAVGAQR